MQGHGDSQVEGTLMDGRLSSVGLGLLPGEFYRDPNSCTRTHIRLEFRLHQEPVLLLIQLKKQVV